MKTAILGTVIAGLALHVWAESIGPKSWPCFRGQGTGITTDTGLKIVSDPKKIRKLWTSEIRNIPYGWCGAGQGASKVGGGYGGPVVVDGRVYVTWWEPSGTVVDEKMRAGARDKRPEKWLVHADELLACMDASNGRTLWISRMEGTGMNHQYHHHCANYHPVVAEGVVCLQGNAGWVYCLDAATGEQIWKARLGGVTDRGEGLKTRRQVHREGNWDKMAMNTAPAIADGVVACNDNSGTKYGHGLVGFDLVSGRELWRVADCCQRMGSPIIWKHGDKRFLIAAGLKRAVCVEPRTGKVLWQIDPPGEVEPLGKGEKKHPRVNQFGPPSVVASQAGTPAVSGDVLVLHPNRSGSNDSFREPWHTGHHAWQISPDGAKLLWRLSRRVTSAGYHATLIYGDRALLQSGKASSVLVELRTGKVLGRSKGGFGRGELQPFGGDGWAYFGGSRIRVDGDTPTYEPLPVKSETYVSSFYASGRLFTRGVPGGVDLKGIPTPSANAIHCYDLRPKP